MTEFLPTHRKRPLALPIAVVGNGIAGMTAALAFAMSGAKVALVVRDAAPYADPRTAALFPASLRLLHNLGVWQACAADAAPLEAVRIVDATSWLLKAPEAVFRASDSDKFASR